MRRPLGPFRFFWWNLLPAFGMICISTALMAAEEGMYNAHGKRDPFIPLVTLTMRSSSSNLLGVDSIDDLVIEGVVYDPQQGSVVIVNGTVLKEGEELAGVKLVKVKVNGAFFLINGVSGFKEIYQEQPANKNNVKKT